MKFLKKNSFESGKATVLEIIELQRRIFERQRRIIESSESHLSSDFSKYRNEYNRSVSGFISVSGFGTLCDAVAASKVAYIADYHTLALAQRTFVKLIRGIMSQIDHICLCLEFVPAAYQQELDRFMDRKISEKTFLRRIRYREHWPYDIWQNFKPIFDLAMEQGFMIVGIDSDSSLSLKKRDKLAAQKIAEAAQKFPNALLLVFAGQMHVAPLHLPFETDRAFIKHGLSVPERVIVYQNAEEIYWQLAKERREGIEVVKVDANIFCVNNTPPLVQQLSYLNWIQSESEVLEHLEAEITIRSLIKNLGVFLDISWQEAASSVKVLLSCDLEFGKALDDERLTSIEKQQILINIKSGDSACISKLNLVYLARLSLNHAAEESAHYLKQMITKDEIPQNLKDRFYFYTVNEACAFLGSKIINPKRKTEHEGKLRKTIAETKRGLKKMSNEQRAAAFALAHIRLERQKKPISSQVSSFLKDPTVFHQASHILGYILGDRLYYALTSGIITKKMLKSLFEKKIDSPGIALNTYFDLSEKLRNVELPRRI